MHHGSKHSLWLGISLDLQIEIKPKLNKHARDVCLFAYVCVSVSMSMFISVSV